jgi:hypothetical protein
MYIRFKAIILLAVLFLLPSCRKEEKFVVSSKNELYIFLDTLELRYEKAYSSVQLALLHQAGLSDSAVTDSGWSEAAKIFLDTSVYNTILKWHNRSGSLADEELGRRLNLWYRTCLGGRIFFDPAINPLREKLYNNYKQNLKISESLTASLKKEKNQSRRKEIYNRITHQQSELIPEYIKLVKLYNKKVKELGFPNYYSFLLYLDDVNEMWLLQTIKNLEKHSRAVFYSMLDAAKKKYKTPKPGPWDLNQIYGSYPELSARYFSADSFLDNIRQFTASIGVPIESLSIKIIKKKSISSRCFVISIPDDIQLTIGNQSGMEPFQECLHALGEAFRAATIEVKYPILKGYNFIPGAVPASFHEGVTNVFQEFLDDSSRLAKIHGIREKHLRDYLTSRSASDLYNMRLLIKEFFVEYELYKDPDQDLDTLASVAYNKYLSDTSADNIDLRFAPTLQEICFNGTYHTTILRDLISAQLYEALLNKFGSDSTFKPETAAWLINSINRNGELLEWDDRIRSATGKSVEPGAFLRKLRLEHTNLLQQ